MIATGCSSLCLNLSTWESKGGVPQVQSQPVLKLSPCVKTKANKTYEGETGKG